RRRAVRVDDEEVGRRRRTAGGGTAAAAAAARGGHTIEKLAAVGADAVVGRAGHEIRRASIGQAIAVQNRSAAFVVAAPPAAGAGLQVIHRARDAGAELRVLPFGDAGHRKNALLNPGKIDLHRHRRAERAPRAGLLARLTASSASAPAAPPAGRRTADALILVALRQQRTGIP